MATAKSDVWTLQDAKARLSELVERARSGRRSVLPDVHDPWSASS
ncbi:MAG: type II toxin-antitoxin system prevent-host-death family antitoxin [Candidatus Eremiobacteraeota bacterium]|nr:type II toxin-antitoxin system prevent-host-death family antitoxin [Candidatus Eremiobacteraeota bacterium]MBC5803948.1 type II toxin-antitoxin system prevent-host-death family antitoxin [Candidatus Eremiobacteraeota bacterium]MBC5822356.1 type II toxin-antitoxin system prevent-host-death family antitoxin [Candidatus Eremiobacteraeota bacterium]